MSDYEKIKQLILTLDWENVQLAKELDRGLKTGAWDDFYNLIPKALVNDKVSLMNGHTDESIRMQLIESICTHEYVYNTLLNNMDKGLFMDLLGFLNQANKKIEISGNNILSLSEEKFYENILLLPF